MTGLQNSEHPGRAGFQWRRFSRHVTAKVRRDGRGVRPIAADIGITYSDLQRALGGQVIGPHKVIALCFWIGRDIHEYYIWPDGVSRQKCFTFDQLKQLVLRVFSTIGGRV